MKIRPQTYSLEQYLKLMQKETIRTDQECQRLSGQWNPGMMSELFLTVLTNGYIPPVILGEEVISGIEKLWIIDGLQRSTSFSMFKYGGTRISRYLDEYIVTYQRKVLDGNGDPKRDSKGEIIWESVEFDVRGKTYEQLPEELQDRFNEYQLETVIHQDCDMMQISKLVRKYNNHRPMNNNQKAFTYIENFARDIREITENRFFLDVYSGGAKDKLNGKFERVVGDIVVLCNYPDQYKNDIKKVFKWLNENASLYDFQSVNELLTRLTVSVDVTAQMKELFTSKHAHIFIAAFKAFTESGGKDKEFGEFLDWFVNDGNRIEIDEKSWKEWDSDRSTRDTAIVQGKLNHVVKLMEQYFKALKKAA